MSLNLASLQQKADQVIHNADEAIRKWQEFITAPAGTVQMQYYDQNGNLKTASFPNRNKVVNDFIGNVNSAMNKIFYVDAVNGNDNNDGSQANPFKTIKKAIDSVPVGGNANIYLKEGQTFDITQDIVIINKTIKFERWGSTNPKIIAKFSTITIGSNTYGANYNFKLGNSSLSFWNVDFEVEENTTSYSNSSSAIGIISSIYGGVNSVFFRDSNITSNNTGLASGRDYGFMSVYLFNCNVDNTNAAILHITNGAGALVVLDSNFSDSSNYVSGIVKDSNGVPRNVVSNIVL